MVRASLQPWNQIAETAGMRQTTAKAVDSDGEKKGRWAQRPYAFL